MQQKQKNFDIVPKCFIDITNRASLIFGKKF